MQNALGRSVVAQPISLAEFQAAEPATHADARRPSANDAVEEWLQWFLNDFGRADTGTPMDCFGSPVQAHTLPAEFGQREASGVLRSGGWSDHSEVRVLVPKTGQGFAIGAQVLARENDARGVVLYVRSNHKPPRVIHENSKSASRLRSPDR